MAVNLRKTEEPGLFVDLTSGTFVELIEARVDDRVDTNVVGSGAIAANDKEKYFETLTNKERSDANFPEVQKICASGERMDVERFFVYIPGAFGNTVPVVADFKKTVDNLFFEWKLNRAIVSEGLAVKYPPGYGTYGSTAENAASLFAIGIPSSAAQEALAQGFKVGNKTQVQVVATWLDRTWDATNMPTLAGKVHVRAGFHGILYDAATKNV